MSLVMRCRSEEGNVNLWDVSKKMFSVFFLHTGDPDTQSYHGNGCQEGIFPSGSSSVGGMYGCQGVGTTSLKWQPHVTDTWTTLCDENLCDMYVFFFATRDMHP